ncbi:MAG: hypothetical protein ACRDR6_27855 [Pseudonocardiaceae bacterium]
MSDTIEQPRMFRRKYVLAKDTPKLAAGTAVWFDQFQGDYTNEPISLAARGQIERFSFAEVENPEWFTPASDLVQFRPPMIPFSKVSSYPAGDDGCVLVTVESRHNDMCDWCRNARGAIERTQREVLGIAYEVLKRHYDAEGVAEVTPGWIVPGVRERNIDGLLRAAANTAPKVVGGELGGQLRQLMWVYYNTAEAYGFADLARAILAHERLIQCCPETFGTGGPDERQRS